MYRNIINGVKIKISIKVPVEWDCLRFRYPHAFKKSWTSQNSQKSGHSRLCNWRGKQPQWSRLPSLRITLNSEPFWMHEGILLDFQWPLRVDMDLPHLVGHRRVDGVVRQPLCHAIEWPCHLAKADGYSTGSTCDLYCFGILSGRQVGYLARSNLNHW